MNYLQGFPRAKEVLIFLKTYKTRSTTEIGVKKLVSYRIAFTAAFINNCRISDIVRLDTISLLKDKFDIDATIQLGNLVKIQFISYVRKSSMLL